MNFGVISTYSPITWEVEAERSEFKDSLGCIKFEDNVSYIRLSQEKKHSSIPIEGLGAVWVRHAGMCKLCSWAVLACSMPFSTPLL